MRRIREGAGLLLILCLALTGRPAAAQAVTSDGWQAKSKGLTFYIEVPMIDNKELKDYGVGRNITAKAIGTAVRYVDKHPQIDHLVFLMDTGGGSLMHAEAMEDVIDRHHKNTTYHIVVKNAISAGIWTAFSCDNIFMCTGGTIGGATAYYHTFTGESIVSSDIPYIAGRLEITAKRNGYPREVIKPLMQMNSELHYWTNELGIKVLSNKAPEDRSAVSNYRFMDQKNTVLTLTADDAVQIGIAKPIEAFDGQLVGEKIGAQGWTRANRFGRVADEIGYVYNTARALEDHWSQSKLNLPRFPVTTLNRNNSAIKQMLVDRRKYETVLSTLREIVSALEELALVHPERHAYLVGEDNTTIVPDLGQWEADTQAAIVQAGRLTNAIPALTRAYKDVQVDERNLDNIVGPLRDIALRVQRIKLYGNAAYWASLDQ